MEVPVRDDLSVADLHAMVKKTLAVVNFAVLATAEDAVPSPVFYAHDNRPAIYWGSSRSCRRDIRADCNAIRDVAQTHHLLSAQGAIIHELFTTTSAISAGSPAATEAANAIAVG